jgi:hypothetical protein
MSKSQKDDLKSKAGDDVKMVNRYTDGAGCVRVSGPYLIFFVAW